MRARKIVVFVVILIVIGIMFAVGSISYSSGVSYGESNAEEIRKNKIISIDSLIETPKKYVAAAFTINERSPIKVKSSGRVVPGKIINISSEVQGVLESGISLKKGSKFT